MLPRIMPRHGWGQWGVTWWQTSQSFPLSRAADLLNGSAEWLRSLVEQPLAGIAADTGAEGPLVDIGAGITARFATAPLTGPPEGAARLCEVTGIIIGLVTGGHPLVLACAKRLAHDAADQLLSAGFKHIFGCTSAETRGPGTSQSAAPGGRGLSLPSPPDERTAVGPDRVRFCRLDLFLEQYQRTVEAPRLGITAAAWGCRTGTGCAGRVARVCHPGLRGHRRFLGPRQPMTNRAVPRDHQAAAPGDPRSAVSETLWRRGGQDLLLQLLPGHGVVTEPLDVRADGEPYALAARLRRPAI